VEEDRNTGRRRALCDCKGPPPPPLWSRSRDPAIGCCWQPPSRRHGQPEMMEGDRARHGTCVLWGRGGRLPRKVMRGGAPPPKAWAAGTNQSDGRAQSVEGGGEPLYPMVGV
jgi:hypothetical protein